MKKRLLIGGIIITVLIVGVGIASYFTIANITNKENAKLVIQINKQKADEKKPTEVILPPAVDEAVVDVADIDEVIDMAHAMANSLIEADTIWDKLPMDKENVIALIGLLDMIKEDSANKTTLVEIANRWKVGDFSKVDKDHDTVWNMIPNASVGESTGINEDEVTKAVSNMK